jgi:hypothetical protein
MTRTAVFFAADPNGGAPFTLAIFVICTQPTHAPDFWQTRSPLGEGFPRHAMLWFHDVTVPYETKRGMRDMKYIALDLPPTVTVDVNDFLAPPETMHTLTVGIIGRTGKEEAFVLGHAETPLKTAPGQTSVVTLAVSTKDAGILKRPQRDVPPHVIKVVSVEPDPKPSEPKTEETVPGTGSAGGGGLVRFRN